MKKTIGSKSDDRDNLWEIVLVVNGSLEMSPGKIAGQTFQAAFRMQTFYARLRMESLVPEWKHDGTRTIVKKAKTQAMFERICKEIPGYTMVDEGHTEVAPNTPTVHVCGPFLHKDRPTLLDNKKVNLL